MEINYSLTKEDKQQFINELKENKQDFISFISINYLEHIFVCLIIVIVCFFISIYCWLTLNQFLLLIISEILFICIYYYILYKNYSSLGLLSLALYNNIKLNIDDEYIVRKINEKFHVGIHYLEIRNVFETKSFYCFEICEFVYANNFLIIKKEFLENEEEKDIFYKLIKNRAENTDKLLFSKKIFFHSCFWLICILLFFLSNLLITFELRDEYKNKNFVVREINNFVVTENSKASKLGIETYDLPLSINGISIKYHDPVQVSELLKGKNATLRFQKRKTLEERTIKINTD